MADVAKQEAKGERKTRLLIPLAFVPPQEVQRWINCSPPREGSPTLHMDVLQEVERQIVVDRYAVETGTIIVGVRIQWMDRAEWMMKPIAVPPRIRHAGTRITCKRAS